MTKRIGIFYFSGTGNTAFIVKALQKELQELHATVTPAPVDPLLKEQKSVDLASFDMIGIVFPIHAFGAPIPITRFIKLLPSVSGMPAFVIENGGGPGDSINDTSGMAIMSTLKKKGFRVFSDFQFVTPSNWVASTPPDTGKQLINAVARKARLIVQEIIQEKPRAKQASAFLSFLSRSIRGSFSVGARFFGMDLYAKKECSRCGICVRQCPAGNIREKKGKIRWGWQCMYCMRCIYACPKKAIFSRLQGIFIAKNWRYAEDLASDTTLPGVEITPETTGGYAGYKKYLLQDE